MVTSLGLLSLSLALRQIVVLCLRAHWMAHFCWRLQSLQGFAESMSHVISHVVRMKGRGLSDVSGVVVTTQPHGELNSQIRSGS